MRRSFSFITLLVLPLIVLGLSYGAHAQEPGLVGGVMAAGGGAAGPASPEVGTFLLSYGPTGVMIYGLLMTAYQIGKGVKITIAVTLTDADRGLAERLVKGIEQLAEAA